MVVADDRHVVRAPLGSEHIQVHGQPLDASKTHQVMPKHSSGEGVNDLVLPAPHRVALVIMLTPLRRSPWSSVM